MKELKICYSVSLGVGVNLILSAAAFSLFCKAAIKYTDWSLKMREDKTKES